MRRAAAIAFLCLLAFCSCSKSRDAKTAERDAATGSSATKEDPAAAGGSAATQQAGQSANPATGSGDAPSGAGGTNAPAAGGAATNPSAGGDNTAGQFSREVSQIEESCPALTVTEVLAGSGHVGEMIRVEGRCLGYGQIRAEGGPPLSKSDWQLEDGGTAVYVNGPLPEGCSPTEGSATRTAIYATIAEDTPPALGGKPSEPRRYLVRVMR